MCVCVCVCVCVLCVCVQLGVGMGTKTVNLQDSSPTHILETVHRQNGDSSPTNLKTVHRQENTHVYMEMVGRNWLKLYYLHLISCLYV